MLKLQTFIIVTLLSIIPKTAINAANKYKTGTKFNYPLTVGGSITDSINQITLKKQHNESITWHEKTIELNFNITYTNAWVCKWLDSYPRLGVSLEYGTDGITKKNRKNSHMSALISFTPVYDYLSILTFTPKYGIGISKVNSTDQNLINTIHSKETYLELLYGLIIYIKLEKNYILSFKLDILKPLLYYNNKQKADTGDSRFKLNAGIGLSYIINPYIIDYRSYVKPKKYKSKTSFGVIGGYKKISSDRKNGVIEQYPEVKGLDDLYPEFGIYATFSKKIKNNWHFTASTNVTIDNTIKKIITSKKALTTYNLTTYQYFGIELRYNIISITQELGIKMIPFSMLKDEVFDMLCLRICFKAHILEHIDLGVNINSNVEIAAGDPIKLFKKFDYISFTLGYSS